MTSRDHHHCLLLDHFVFVQRNRKRPAVDRSSAVATKREAPRAGGFAVESPAQASGTVIGDRSARHECGGHRRSALADKPAVSVGTAMPDSCSHWSLRFQFIYLCCRFSLNRYSGDFRFARWRGLPACSNSRRFYFRRSSNSARDWASYSCQVTPGNGAAFLPRARN